MGYTTWFDGGLKFKEKPSDDFIKYVNDFASIRHMPRDIEKIKEMDKDWAEHCFKKCLGEQGAFYITEENYNDPSIIDYNGMVDNPPTPGLWCQWVINEHDGDYYLEWNEGEKFYSYVGWLHFLIDNFIAPDGYSVSGEIYWQGEDSDDRGVIVVYDNQVKVGYAEVTYVFDEDEEEN